MRKLSRLIQSLLVVLLPTAIVTLLCISRGNVESFLKAQIPSARPDAFLSLEDGIWTLLTVSTCQCLLALVAIGKDRSLLLLPLYAGTSIGAILWLATGDMQDPNWFQLAALLALGAFVSNLVVICFLLTPRTRKSNQEK